MIGSRAAVLTSAFPEFEYLASGPSVRSVDVYGDIVLVGGAAAI